MSLDENESIPGHAHSGIDKNYCPICGKPNRCGEKKVINGIELSRCWCAYEIFPKAIFEKIPEEKNRKVCICQKCLYQFQSENTDIFKLRKILNEFVNQWQNDPKISWTQIYHIGEKLLEWKTQKGIAGIWKKSPKMITATMDDSLGQGLKMIHLFSRIAGIDIMPLGLMLSEETIIDACNNQFPDFLGMTILQYDTEKVLNSMIQKFPDKMNILVGGPIFKAIPRNELQNKKYISFNNVSNYLEFLLCFEME